MADIRPTDTEIGGVVYRDGRPLITCGRCGKQMHFESSVVGTKWFGLRKRYVTTMHCPHCDISITREV